MMRLLSLCARRVLLLVVLCLALPTSVSGQVAAAQIQVSDADAIQQLALTEPTDWQAAMPSLAPWIIVVGADDIGHRDLSGIAAFSESKDGSSGSGGINDRPPPVTVPTARIQVANADGIGRFDLGPIESAHGGDSPEGNTGSKETITSGAPSINRSVTSIQITSADAVGRLALSPIGEPSVKANGSATPKATAAVDTPASGERGSDHAVVIADGKLNVRSGPGQNFDIVGQLDIGTQVTVLKTSDDSQWLLMMDPSGLTGWVKAQFMELVK